MRVEAFIRIWKTNINPFLSQDSYVLNNQKENKTQEL